MQPWDSEIKDLKFYLIFPLNINDNLKLNEHFEHILSLIYDLA